MQTCEPHDDERDGLVGLNFLAGVFGELLAQHKAVFACRGL